MDKETTVKIKELKEQHEGTLHAWVHGTDILKKAFAETVLKIEL